MDGFEKGCALIQANLGIDPCNGDDEEWASNYAKALWLEEWRLKNLAELLKGMLGGDKKSNHFFPINALIK